MGPAPGEVYVKSFLRTYGAFLGLDTRQLLDEFKRQYEAPSDHELRPIAPLGRDRDRDRGPRRLRIPPWVTVVVVLVARGGGVGVRRFADGGLEDTDGPGHSSRHHSLGRRPIRAVTIRALRRGSSCS